MRKINPHQFYQLSTVVHPITTLQDVTDTALPNIFFVLFSARNLLAQHVTEHSILPNSSKRAAEALIAVIHEIGVPKRAQLIQSDLSVTVESWRISQLKKKARDLEIVLANDLPGLDIYQVYRKGIYSTPELIETAEMALMDGLTEDAQSLIPTDALRDFNQAGRCLAFELPTASGFHTMRAVEGVLRKYWGIVKRPVDEVSAPEMSKCINELRSEGEDKQLMDLLDHVRSLRNTLMHPDQFLELHDALRLFDIAKSAISSMAERISELADATLSGSESPPLETLSSSLAVAAGGPSPSAET